ncbi:MAG: hypothetical protein EZS28_029730 [Streblomastix strix]|uniref:Uncharacterized protein n=1 Tax=Streblomastix strix TaxID=222440 RepID=A0A5J4UXD2_9EUKA|nr:MAG: hypothetical protein EZS28_029730 [Streblomastix strix]
MFQFGGCQESQINLSAQRLDDQNTSGISVSHYPSVHRTYTVAKLLLQSETLPRQNHVIQDDTRTNNPLQNTTSYDQSPNCDSFGKSERQDTGYCIKSESAKEHISHLMQFKHYFELVVKNYHSKRLSNSS